MEGIERCDECARYPTDDAAADAHASACRCGLEVAIAPEVLAELLGAVGLVADVRTLPWYEGGPSSARTVAYRPLPRARFFAGVSIEELQPGGCDAVNGEKVAAAHGHLRRLCEYNDLSSRKVDIWTGETWSVGLTERRPYCDMIGLQRNHPTRMDTTTQNPSKLALIFPGQGSQHTGMGRRVAEASPRARAVFDEASEILKIDVTKIVMDGSEKQLAKTTTTQPAILAVSWAYLTYLRERAETFGRQLRPSAGSGHSFGQFSAAAAAESISFADALTLVRERGRIMTKWSKKRPGGMASVIGPSDDDIRGMLQQISPDGDVGVAAVNAPGQTVISGTLAALSRAIDTVKERGARVVQLPISVPGHFPKMAEAREELRKRIDDADRRAIAEDVLALLAR